jgi:hypothetical protein
MPRTGKKPSSPATLLDSALTYAARGWPVFPCHSVNRDVCSCTDKHCTRAGKHPRTLHGLKDASSDPAQIRAWWTRWKDANIGVPAGRPSGLLVVDLDSEDAIAIFTQLGPKPETLTHKTGRGRHVLYNYPSNVTIRNDNKGKLGKGIDIRGDGGYFIAPPSLHCSGIRYAVHDHSPLADPPIWLVEALKVQAPVMVTRESPQPQRNISEGGRNTKLTSLAGTMQRRGMSPAAIEAALQAENEDRCDPPLEATEVRKIVQSVTRSYPSGEDATDSESLFVGHDSIATLVTKADRAFAGMPGERLFKRPVSGQIVHVIEYREAPGDKGVQYRDPEASIMVDADATYLRDILSSSGKVFRYNRQGAPVPADPPRDVTETLIARAKTSPDKVTLPSLRMLSNAPILLGDLRIICEGGFHAESGIYITAPVGRFSDSEPDELLTVAQCRALWEADFDPCFCEIPYPKEEDKAVVKSAALSIASRNLLPTVPAHCITGPVQGSGKSLTVQLVSILATGTLPTAVSYDGAEEFGKLLLPLLAKGERLINVDNVLPTINNQRLAIGLTQKGRISWRLLGRSEDRIVENHAVFMFNGNNLLLTGEISRRAVIGRIEPNCEHPEDRKFPFKPLPRAHELHPRAAMTLLRVTRAHARSGFPGLKLLDGDAGGFSEWSEWVRAALVWMGYADPWKTQEAIRESDPGRAGNEELVAMLRAAIGDRECFVREIKGTLTLDDCSRLLELTNHKPGEPFNELKVGQYFGRLRDRWFGACRLVWGKNPSGKRKWRVERRAEHAQNTSEITGDPL